MLRSFGSIIMSEKPHYVTPCGLKEVAVGLRGHILTRGIMAERAVCGCACRSRVHKCYAHLLCPWLVYFFFVSARKGNLKTCAMSGSTFFVAAPTFALLLFDGFSG